MDNIGSTDYRRCVLWIGMVSTANQTSTIADHAHYADAAGFSVERFWPVLLLAGRFFKGGHFTIKFFAGLDQRICGIRGEAF